MKLEYFGTKYQMINQRLNSEVIKKDTKPYVDRVVKFYKATRYDKKFFVFGFVMGLYPYVTHELFKWF